MRCYRIIMKYLSSIFGLILLGTISFLVSPTHAARFTSDNLPSISSPLNDDGFLAGNSVSVTAPISGDVFAGGTNVTIKEKIGQSAYIAGVNLVIEGGVGHNLWIVGQSITIKGDIGHDVYVAGQNITIDPNTHIHGQLRAAGNTISVAGVVDGDALISVSDLTTKATYSKNVTLEATAFHFSGGSVMGDLIYRSAQPMTDFGGMTVKGAIHFETASYVSDNVLLIRSAILGVLAMFVVGAALLLFAGRKVKDVTEMVQNEWVRSLGFGVVALVVTPLLVLLLVATKVGLALALVILALYAVFLYTAGAMASMVVGMRGMKLLRLNYATMWVPFILALIVLGVIQVIPVLAPIILLAFFIGVILPVFGAEVLWWKSVLQGKG